MEKLKFFEEGKIFFVTLSRNRQNLGKRMCCWIAAKQYLFGKNSKSSKVSTYPSPFHFWQLNIFTICKCCNAIFWSTNITASKWYIKSFKPGIWSKHNLKFWWFYIVKINCFKNKIKMSIRARMIDEDTYVGVIKTDNSLSDKKALPNSINSDVEYYARR